MDTPKRSWVKSITWRIVGIIILGLIAYWLTKDWKAMTGITLIFNFVRLILYYGHERIWERIAWGRLHHPLEHLPVRSNLSEQDYRIIQEFLEKQEYSSDQPEYQI